jgi:hypothetical protein
MKTQLNGYREEILSDAKAETKDAEGANLETGETR